MAVVEFVAAAEAKKKKGKNWVKESDKDTAEKETNN